MKIIKQILRTTVIVLMITLASFGAGIAGAIIPPKIKREENENNTEMVDEREEDDEQLN